jgi:small-conductance mechanosensitive channel
VSELLNFVWVSRSDCFQDRLIFEVKELADSEVRIRVRPPHKAIADQADVEFLHKEEFKELGNDLLPITNHQSRSWFLTTPPNRELLARKPSSAE